MASEVLGVFGVRCASLVSLKLFRDRLTLFGSFLGSSCENTNFLGVNFDVDFDVNFDDYFDDDFDDDFDVDFDFDSDGDLNGLTSCGLTSMISSLDSGGDR